MIMERTAVCGTATSPPFPLGTVSTGSLALPPQPGSSTLLEVRKVEAILDQVLDLEPLERRRVTLHVRSVRPAEFYFVDDGTEDVNL